MAEVKHVRALPLAAWSETDKSLLYIQLKESWQHWNEAAGLSKLIIIIELD